MTKLTQAGKDLIVEALQMLQDAYEAQAKEALDDDDHDAFHTFANKALNAKFVRRQVEGGKP